MVTLYISEVSYPPMTTIATLALLAILVGATLSINEFSVMSSVDAQTPTGDNTSMTGNMTGGNVTGGNMTGSISSFDESENGGGTVTSDDSEGGCIDC
jgi:hypothetical protein